MLRDALLQACDVAVSSARVAYVQIAEEEAERSRAAGAVSGHQTALIIASRIRKQSIRVADPKIPQAKH